MKRVLTLLLSIFMFMSNINWVHAEESVDVTDDAGIQENELDTNEEVQESDDSVDDESMDDEETIIQETISEDEQASMVTDEVNDSEDVQNTLSETEVVSVENVEVVKNEKANAIEGIQDSSTPVEFNGHTYLVVEDAMSWHDAVQYCRDQGGYLATVGSQEENDFLGELIEADIWIGGTDEGTEGEWRWITGETFEYSSWEQEYGESNGGINENSLERFADGTWNDAYGSFEHLFVCEFGPEAYSMHYVLNLSANINGRRVDSLDGYATVDVYIDGELVADDVVDYTGVLPEGTEYSIRDVQEMDDASFLDFANSGSGTITDSNVDVVLDFEIEVEEDEEPEPTQERVEFNGHTYLLVGTPMTWYDANDYCLRLGGHLATITSQEEDDFLSNLAVNTYWLGGTDRDSEGEWRWIIGESFDYQNWEYGQPDDSLDNNEGCENYLCGNFPNWNDYPGNYLFPFVCEFESESGCSLMLSASVSGRTENSLEGLATVDVYINGELVADDVSDYLTFLEEGTEYSFEDVQTVDGVTFLGFSNGGSGTIVDSYVDVVASFDVDSYMMDITEGTYSRYVDQGETIEYRFTPTESGTYFFYGINNKDSFAKLYDANHNEITYDDDGGSHNQFRIAWDLEAGTTYYFAARWYSDSTSGNMKVVLEKYVQFEIVNQPTVVEGSFYTDLELSIELTPVASQTSLWYSWEYSEDGEEWFWWSNDRTVVLNGVYDGTQFRCTISDDQGYSLTSDPITISMKADATVIEDGTFEGYFEGDSVYFSFTPQESGLYTLRCESDWAIYVYLYDHNMGNLGYWYIDSSNDVVQMGLEAGKTYYFAVYNPYYEECSFSGYIQKQDSNDITEGTHVSYISAGEIVEYRFTPTESGVYYFFSRGDEDSYAILYDENHREITRDDDAMDNGQFRIAYNMEAGRTYYYAVNWCNGDVSENMMVVLEKYVPFEIASQPTVVEGFLGTNIEMSVEPTQVSDATSFWYYWERSEDGEDWQYWSYSKKAIVTDSYYGWQFRCTVTDDQGYSLTSDPITVHILHDYQEIEEGTHEGSYDGTHPVYFSFTPEEGGVFYFGSDGETELEVTVYNESLQPVNSFAMGEGYDRSPTVLRNGEEYCYAVRAPYDDECTFTVTLEKGETIDIEEGTYVNYMSRSDMLEYRFTPEESGYYYFHSKADYYTIGYLYDEDRNKIAEDYYGFDNGQFRIAHELEAGNTYYYVADWEWDGHSGDMTVLLEKYVPFEIASQPTVANVYRGGDTALSVELTPVAEGTSFSYYWECSEDGMDWWDWSYDRTLKVNDSHVEYQYRCTITDDHGYSLTSEPITLREKLDAQEIEEGTYEGTYDGSEPLYFSFTPEETDTYRFYSESETRLWVKLFDENFEWLGEWNTGNGYSVSSTRASLEEGQTYYYVVVNPDYEACSFAITLDRSVACELVEGTHVSYVDSGEVVEYRFTPTDSGVYYFYGRNNEDSYATLYDADHNEIRHDDDGGGNYQFKIVENLEAGNTYYYGTRWYNSDTSGNMMVVLEKYVPFEIINQPTEVTGLLDTDVELTIELTQVAEATTLWYYWDYWTDDEGWMPWSDDKTIVVNSSYNGYQFRCTITDDQNYSLTSDPITLRFRMEAQPIEDGTYEGNYVDSPVYFSFTPEDGGIYAFYCESELPIEVELYDDRMSSIDRWSIGQNYKVVKKGLQAGKTYYYAVENPDGEVCSFTGSIQRIASTVITEGTQSKYVGAGEVVEYSFTPAESNIYYFYGLNDEDSYATLYDESHNEICYDDDGGDGYQFQIVQYLEEGHTYYYAVKWLNGDVSGKMMAVLEKYVPFEIANQPTELETNLGIHVEMSIELSQVARRTSFWYDWECSEDGEEWSYFSGSSNPTISVGDSHDGWQFRCTITDDQGRSIVSEPITVHFVYDGQAIEEGTYEGSYDGTHPVYFSFTPEEGGVFYFDSNAETELEVTVYNESLQPVNSFAMGEGYDRSPTVLKSGEQYCYAVRAPYDDACTFTVTLQKGETIDIEEGTYVNSLSGSDMLEYRFTPEESGYYYFHSKTDYYTIGYLYDEGHNKIAEDYYYSFGNGQFRIACELEAGNTYYYVADWVYEDSGDMTVMLEKYVPFVIANQPTRVEGYLGTDIEIAIEPSQMAEATIFDYYWEYSEDGEDWSDWSWSRTAIVNDTYDGYLFRCTITDDQGYSITSDPITLRIVVEAQAIEEGTYEGYYNGENIVYYSFTPEQGGYYCFYSDSGNSLLATLYNEDMDFVERWYIGNEYAHTDSKYLLKKGQKYYYGVTSAYGSECSFAVTLEKYNAKEVVPGTYTETVGHEFLEYSFVPEESGIYYFYSIGGYGCIADLYDSEYNLLAEDCETFDGFNFRIMYDLEAGSTYYYSFRRNSYYSDELDVVLEKYTPFEISSAAYVVEGQFDHDAQISFDISQASPATFFDCEWEYSENGVDWNEWVVNHTEDATAYFHADGQYDGCQIRCTVTDDAGRTVTSPAVTFAVVVDDMEIDEGTYEGTYDCIDPAYFSVAPTENGYYYFYSESDEPLVVTLYGEHFTYLDEWNIGGDAHWYEHRKYLVAGKKYYYAVRNTQGQESTFTVTLEKYMSPAFAQPLEDTRILYGETLTLEANLIELAKATRISYRWERTTDGKRWTTVGTTPSVDFYADDDLHLNQFKLTVNDETGARIVSGPITVTVYKIPLVLVDQPVDSDVEYGAMATFATVAEGKNVGYLWQCSEDDTFTSFTEVGEEATLNVDALHPGYYRCYIYDSQNQDLYTDTVRLSIGENIYPVIADDGEFSVKQSSNGFHIVPEESGTYAFYYAMADGSFAEADVTLYDDRWYELEQGHLSTEFGYGYDFEAGNAYHMLVPATDNNALTLVAAKYEEPRVVTNQQDITVFDKTNVSMDVAARGVYLRYQWEYSDDGDDWQELDGSSLMARYYHNGRLFRCRITDVLQDVIYSDPFTLTVNKRPLVAEQLPETVSVEYGDDMSLSVALLGDHSDVVNYEWQASTNGTDWHDLSEYKDTYYDGYAGAETNALALTLVRSSTETLQLRCVLTDDQEQETITNATLVNVYDPQLEFTVQPQSVTVPEGGKVTFSVKAIAKVPSYQWQRYDADWTDISGANKDSYSFVPTANGDETFRCLITDIAGNVIVSETVGYTMQLKPAIVQQPNSQQVGYGTTATFTIDATGTNFTYAWEYSDGGSWKAIGGNENVLSFTATVEDGYRYRCILTDDLGQTTTSDEVTLTVYPLPELVQQPADAYKAIGDTAAFTAEINETDATYHWQIRENAEAEWNDLQEGMDAQSISVAVAENSDGNQVRCVIVNKHGSVVETEAATMHVVTPVAISNEIVDQYAISGSKASVTVDATGDGLTYQWYIKNRSTTKFSKSSVTKATYSTTMSDTVDGRQVYCVVADQYGYEATSAIVTLYKYTPLAIVTEPSDVVVDNGQKAATTVEATGDGLTYQWYIKNKTASKFSKSSVTKATYSTTMSDTVDGRQAYCVITDILGNTVTTNTVTLSKYVFEIIAQPQDVTVDIGEKANVTVEAKGEGLTYTWYLKNKTATKFSKSSVTKATYSVAMSDTVDGRQVYCVVTDKNGDTITTDTVTLSKYVFEIISQPQDAMVDNGEKAVVTVEAKGEGLTYAWYLKGRTATMFSKSSITKATYSVTMSDTVDGRQLYCVVTDKNGDTLTTDTVTLHKYVFEIVAQPQDVTVDNGKKASVTVEAKGEGLTYQWYIKNKTATKFTKSSVTKATYSTTMSDTVDGRQVYCVVTDKNGDTLTTDTVTLHKYVFEVVSQPQNATAKNGEKVSTTVEARGEGLAYTWYIKNKIATKFTKSSVTKATYSTTMSDTVDGRQAYCIVTDKNGDTITTDTVTLSRSSVLAIVSEPEDVLVESGQKAIATVVAEGDGLTYQWYIKNRTASKFSKSSVTKATYSVTMSDTVDGRQAYCVVTDKDGNSVTTRLVTFTMFGFRIIGQPADVSVAAGEKAQATVNAIGNGLTYQWYIKNRTASKFSKSSVTKATYSVTMSDTVDGRQAYCIVTDENGEQLQTDTVTFTMIGQ